MNDYRNDEYYPDPTPYHALKRVERKYYPLVYICSPFRGDTEVNQRKAQRFCRFAVSKGNMPLAPHLLFPQFMDDGDSDERELAFLFNMVLIPKCDELWVFGRPTDGMEREIHKAKRCLLPIRFFNDKCEEVEPL